MTVRDWIVSRSSGVPAELTRSVLALLGKDADEPASRAGEVCLDTASRSLGQLLDRERHGRDSALPLLAIDALTTFAFEHASESGSPDVLKSLAQRGAKSMSQIPTRD